MSTAEEKAQVGHSSAGAGHDHQTAEEIQLTRCRAGKCPVPPTPKTVERATWYCPTCRKKWSWVAGRGSWALADSFKLTAEQEADVEQLTERRVTSHTGGQKGQKLARYDLIPGEALRKIAELYGRGAGKYDDRNWELGYDWSLSFAALQRHIWQFWNGEDMDEEMGMEHVACAMFHAFALLTFMDEHPEFDDRPSTLKRASETLPKGTPRAERHPE